MTTTFTQTRNSLITDSLQLLGVYGVGRTVSSEDMSIGVSMLSKMVKAWGAKGLHLWAKQEAVLFLTKGTSQYSLTTSKAVDADALVSTTLSAAEAAAQTTLSITSTTGMTIGDNVGIVLDNDTIHWTTISTLSPFVIVSALPSAASSANVVYTYTSGVSKPLNVLQCRLRNASGLDIPMGQIDYQDYYEIGRKTNTGLPNQWHYIPKTVTGTMSIWPSPSLGTDRVMFTYERINNDISTANADFDFPAEWLEALTWQLAVRLAPAFGKGSKGASLLPIASSMLQDLQDWDRDISDLEVSPDIEGY